MKFALGGLLPILAAMFRRTDSTHALEDALLQASLLIAAGLNRFSAGRA